MSYVSRWQTLKHDFEANSGKARPKETTKKAIIGTVEKSSGVTPILKEIDTALEKKERLPLEKAVNKLMVVRSSYGSFLFNEQKQFLHDPNDPNMVVWTAYQSLIKGLEKLEADASADAKKLQETKNPGKVAIALLSLEGDLKGTIAAAKKDLAPFAALEKQLNVLKKADTSLKDAEKYTKAAAHQEYKNAREALEAFQKDAGKCGDELTTIAGNIKNNDAFKKAVEKFRDAMKALAVLSRVATQIKNLKDAEKAMTAGA